MSKFLKLKYLKVIFLFFYIFSILLFKIPMNYGGDEKTYILMTNHFFFFFFYFEADWQYAYRWGMYIFSSLFYSLFGSNPLTFYLSSSLPIILSLFIYLNLFKKFFSKKLKDFFFITFFILWFFNSEIINMTFNLVTEGQGVFALSLVLYFFFKINQNKTRTNLTIFLFSLSCFYLYGVKEINLFLIFPLLIISFINFNQLDRLKLIFFGLSLFLIECFLVYYLSDYKFISRFHYLLFNSDSILNKDLYFTETIKKYPDGGVLSRWINIYTISKLFFPFAFFSSLYFLLNSRKIPKEIVYLSITLITYFLLVTFAFKSLNPLVSFVPIKIQNLTVSLPICFLIIIYIVNHITFSKIIIFSYSILMISFLIRPFNYIYKITIPEIKQTNHNILNVYSKFNELDNYYYKTGCLKFYDKNSKNIFILFSKYKNKEILKNEVRYDLFNPKCNTNKKIIRKISIIEN